MGLREDVAKVVREIVPHTVAMILCVLSIWIFHGVLEYSLGADAKFFDLIPVRYVADAGHLAVMVKFVISVIRVPWH